ncbi:MAG: hypothetical protein NVSMB62_27090 [Acidobacteriaceae bacterium]
MSTSETYRLKKAILYIYCADTAHGVPVVVPSGAIVTITDGPLDGLRMVDVLWEKKKVMMFTIDLRSRAMLIEGTLKGVNADRCIRARRPR